MSAHPTRCQGGVGDGCGRIFLNKTISGLCSKCSLLASLDDDSAEFKNARKYGQCKGCGGAWRYFLGGFCDECEPENQAPTQGTTVNNIPPPPQAPQAPPTTYSLSQQAVDKARIERANAVAGRMRKQTNPLHTTNGLNAARSNLASQTPPDKIWIQIEARVNDGSKRKGASTDPMFGRSGRAWGREEFLSEVLMDSLRTFNIVWEKHHSISLTITSEEVELRFSGNKVFHHGTQHGTVGDTFDLYMTGDMAHLYKTTPSGKAAAASIPQMHMEVIIDKISFDKRARALQGTDDESKVISSIQTTRTRTRKRRHRSPSSSGDDMQLQSSVSVLSKRPKTRKDYSSLASRFVRSTLPNRKSSHDDYSKISFIRATNAFVADTSDVEVAWPDEDSVSESGLISKSPMAKGVTKTVHKFMINNNESESFVAKRFFNVGSGPVENTTNSRLLQQELIRLKQGQWFLTLFMESADEKGLEVCKDIKFSDGFLVKEHGGCFDTLADPAVWLIEPRRTTSVVKFSGTLCHPTRSDKIGKTITAFAHFVYEVSQKSMVFADIQGSPMTINGGKAITILFDLMTHTMDMSSGVGDHGKEGITSFVTQHVCDFFCRSLDLPSLQNTQEELDGV